ncbi:MAG: hypothetical protein K2X99_00250 [Gemmatimonadaceae bacterium]|nr:hypothetical protein [Gemmatimonadaceae bacterium]
MTGRWRWGVWLGVLLGCGETVAPARRATLELDLGSVWAAQTSATNDNIGEVRGVRLVINRVENASRADAKRTAVFTKLYGEDSPEFAEDKDEYVVQVELQVFDAKEQFEAVLQAINSRGDTVFRAGPGAFSFANGKPTVSLPVVYVGPGATAVKLQASPRSAATTSGSSAAFSAKLLDASGRDVTPSVNAISWFSLVPDVAFLRGPGAVQGGPRGGSTKIVAVFEPLRLADTVTVTNSSVPGRMELVSGGGQTGVAGTTLPLPIRVRVVNLDGTPAVGVAVRAIPPGGGSTNPVEAVSGADGIIQYVWTLGQITGGQTLTLNVVNRAVSFAVFATSIR